MAAMMSARHARSPVIKIVAGEHESFGGDDDQQLGVPVNAFYVSKSLLLENSTYFNIILDSAPDRAVVFLPEYDYTIVSDWLDFIYQGTLTYSLPLSLGTVHKYLEFADLVGSEKLRNGVMDSLQTDLVLLQSVESLRFLSDNHPSLSTCFDIILEYQAYTVVAHGWSAFIRRRWGGILKDWFAFLRDPGNSRIVTKLLLKVDELSNDKLSGHLMNPIERRDCKWHTHATEESRAECVKRIDQHEIANGEKLKSKDYKGETAKTNGHDDSEDDALAFEV